LGKSAENHGELLAIAFEKFANDRAKRVHVHQE
jgi:hypothetical protein